MISTSTEARGNHVSVNMGQEIRDPSGVSYRWIRVGNGEPRIAIDEGRWISTTRVAFKDFLAGDSNAFTTKVLRPVSRARSIAQALNGIEPDLAPVSFGYRLQAPIPASSSAA